MKKLFGKILFWRKKIPVDQSPDMSQEAVKARRARERVIQSIEAELNIQRTFSEKLADSLVDIFGSVSFILFNVLFFAAWIIVNVITIPGFEPFDPYPFIFLTMTVSLEAIFLSIFVLMSQRRESRVNKLREEVHLQVNMIAEQEITKLIRLVSYLMKHFNVPYKKDPEFREMMKPTDIEQIRREIARQLKLPHD